jgi:SSS family solute:Na+ symporter
MEDAAFWAPLALYAAVVATVTLTARSRSSDAEYFFAGKRLNAVQALLSVVSSETSVATTVVFPAAGLTSGYALVWLLMGYILGRTAVALFYLRKLYESSRLTIYQTMSAQHRILEGAYLLAKYISGGVRYFIGAYALHQILGWHPAWCVVAVAACVAAYSLTGGLKAVVVMDQVQSALIVGTGLFLVFHLLRQVPAGALEAPAFVALDPTQTDFAPALLLGGAVLSIGSHGADQDLLLRILSTRTLKAAQRSLILSGFGAAFLIGVYLTVGYLLRYTGIADLDAKSPLADYVTRGDMPLLGGVFLVLLAAAAMSSLDSTIHSTGAVWKSLAGSNRPGRVWSTLSLFIMVGFAFLFMSLRERHADFLALAMGSMNYVNGGLIGIFTVFTFFSGRLRGRGVVLGLVAGFVTTAVCEWAFARPVPWPYTVLLSSSASFLATLAGGAWRKAEGRVESVELREAAGPSEG